MSGCAVTGSPMRAVGRFLAILAAAVLFAPQIALAASDPLAVPRCACDRGALEDFRHEIASAGTLAEAQQLAAQPVQLARSALARARWLAPGGGGLAEKERQLRDGERAIAAAATPEAVAGAFTAAVTGSPVLADVDVDAPNCHYTTLEIIAIILGFILGIIPGIILLIILC
jgi:hypothetical protein